MFMKYGSIALLGAEVLGLIGGFLFICFVVLG